MVELLILGDGFIGGALARRRPDAVATNREGRNGAVRFDLSDRASWSGLPRARAVVWTFPATPPDEALELRRAVLGGARNLIVLGSTSCWRVNVPESLVDENAPLDLAQPRVQGEEVLRASGATVACLAGLWGAERDPVRWLTQGRIRDGAKYVNLVHQDDVVAVLEALLERPMPGVRLNVSDGRPRRWREHVERLIAQGRLPTGFTLPETGGGDSKRIASVRMPELLPGQVWRTLT